ncbi:MAG TPA: HAMP domain-containing sensor histidine kinase [Nitrososphaeraceae archaeon]|nr:HAMP domain-containing sensor histidine kinase [Nitrososphaeraceae archaeon]
MVATLGENENFIATKAKYLVMGRPRSLSATLAARPKLTRELSIYVAAMVTVLAVISLLLTRQIMYFDNTLQTLLYLLIVILAFGIGSWVLLEYTKRVSASLRARSRFIRWVHRAVTIVQFALLGIMVSLIFYNSAYCYDYFSFCSTHLSTVSLTAISSGAAAVVLGLFAYKFFAWYKSTRRNFILLFYGLATAALCISIAGDAIAKFVVTEVVIDDELTSAGSTPDSSFVYNTFSKYQGDVKYRVTNPEGSTLYVAPEKYDELYDWINYITSYPRYILLWISTCLLLHFYYQRIGQRLTKFPIRYWALLFIPLLLYLIGSGLIFSLPDDSESRYYQRIIYRAGTIGSSVLFGAAFYLIARDVPSGRVKDYLTISAIGIIMVGVAFSISAFQQTYGAAGHSLVFISSYLFALGFYASAIFLTQDTKLRESIKKTAYRESELLIREGTPHLEQEIERRVLASAHTQEQILIDRSGVQPSLTPKEMKQYLSKVLNQITLLKNYEEIVKKEKDIVSSSLDLMACLNSSGIRLAYNTSFEEYKKIMLQKYTKGEHKGIRIVTQISKESAEIINKFLEIGIQVKHVDNLPPIDFMVSDREVVAKVHKIEHNIAKNNIKNIGSVDWDVRNLLVSNEQAYIDYFLYTFSELWNNGTSARERLDCIQQGLEPGFLEVIKDGKRATRTLMDLARSIKEEAQILLPNEQTMVNLERLGAIDLIGEISSRSNVRIRLISPIAESNSKIVDKIFQKFPKISMINGNSSTSLMFLADGSKFMSSELARPLAENFVDSLGFSVYSNTRESVEAVKTFFNLLWEEHIRNEELKNTDILQRDFINIAAHELRTPIQPILGLSEIMYAKAKDPDERRSLEVIVRNAKRLRKLTENILDLNRIESRRLRLEKENFSMRRLLGSMIADYQKSIQNKGMNTDLIFSDGIGTEELNVNADLNRITQVIFNLINNSLKYTENGRIEVNARTQNGEVIVTISDSGTGIDPAILPTLFTKFTSKSMDGGTGLGLYISKSIVEAHNGRIWGGNNLDGKGATFSFSLPQNLPS